MAVVVSVMFVHICVSVSVMWCQECWATDGAARGGQYFFYLSMGPDEVGDALFLSLGEECTERVSRSAS